MRLVGLIWMLTREFLIGSHLWIGSMDSSLKWNYFALSRHPSVHVVYQIKCFWFLVTPYKVVKSCEKPWRGWHPAIQSIIDLSLFSHESTFHWSSVLIITDLQCFSLFRVQRKPGNHNNSLRRTSCYSDVYILTPKSFSLAPQNFISYN